MTTDLDVKRSKSIIKVKSNGDSSLRGNLLKADFKVAFTEEGSFKSIFLIENEGYEKLYLPCTFCYVNIPIHNNLTLEELEQGLFGSETDNNNNLKEHLDIIRAHKVLVQLYQWLRSNDVISHIHENYPTHFESQVSLKIWIKLPSIKSTATSS